MTVAVFLLIVFLSERARARAWGLALLALLAGCTSELPVRKQELSLAAPGVYRLGLVLVAGEHYRIADIGMRMLQPRELFRAQGFPDSYRIEADSEGRPFTKTEQVRMCGNSVCPPVAAAIVRANLCRQAAAEVA